MFFKNDVKTCMIFSGAGNGVTKTISCVEIIKRKHPNLYQNSKIAYTVVKETWEPTVSKLDKLVVTREIPTIFILLSKVQLDKTEAGYQDSQSHGTMCLSTTRTVIAPTPTTPIAPTPSTSSLKRTSDSRSRHSKKQFWHSKFP